MNKSRSTEQAALSVVDASIYLGVSTDTVRRLIRAGTIAHARIGKSIRIPRTELETFLASQTTNEWQRVDGRGRGALAPDVPR